MRGKSRLQLLFPSLDSFHLSPSPHFSLDDWSWPRAERTTRGTVCFSLPRAPVTTASRERGPSQGQINADGGDLTLPFTV